MRVSIGDANAGVRGKVPLIQRRSTGERVSAVPMMMSSTSGAGYASTARGSRLAGRSEEHTSELQSLMRISYAVFCLKKKKHQKKQHKDTYQQTITAHEQQ